MGNDLAELSKDMIEETEEHMQGEDSYSDEYILEEENNIYQDILNKSRKLKKEDGVGGLGTNDNFNSMP